MDYFRAIWAWSMGGETNFSITNAYLVYNCFTLPFFGIYILFNYGNKTSGLNAP